MDPIGLDHATQMILDLCGGEASEVVIAGAIPDHSRAIVWTQIACNPWSVWKFLPRNSGDINRTRFRIDGDMAHVPSWRPDVLGEADLVEEVARVASLTKLQGKPLPRTTTGVPRRS